MGHWYTNKGEARHTYINKKGEEKDTTLRQARSENLLPSVTTVISDMMKNEMLERWKVKMGILTTMESSRGINEDERQFVNRIIHESMQKSRDATDFGTEVHHHIEQYNLAPEYTLAPDTTQFGMMMVEILEYWKKFYAEKIEQVIYPELRLATPAMGVAGTVDLVAIRKDCGLTVNDFKTQDVKEQYGVTFWETFPIQLSLYARMYRINEGLSEDPRIASQVINSNKAEEIHDKLYTIEEQQNALALGLSLARAWFLRKNYTPRGCDLYDPDVWLR